MSPPPSAHPLPVPGGANGRWIASFEGRILGADVDPAVALAEARKRRPDGQPTLRYVEAPGDADLNLAPLLARLAPLLDDRDGPVFLVGGAVRDALLGRRAYDLDFAVPAGAIRLAFHVGDALGSPAFVLDRERDTGRVMLPDGGVLDFAAFRGPDLLTDLAARDFTINAMALPATARRRASLVDPLGGQADLLAGRLRLTHSNALRDDPIRALRGVRLGHALALAPDGAVRAATAAAGALLADSSAERIRDELVRLLGGTDPAGGLERLESSGLLAIVLPELAALGPVAQGPPHHEPVLAHTIRVVRWLDILENLVAPGDETVIGDPTPFPAELDEAQALLRRFAPALAKRGRREVTGRFRGRQLLRWGALWHDAGKALTRTVDESGRVRFLGHAEQGASLAAHRLRRLRFSNEAIAWIRAMVTGHMRPLLLAREPRVSRRAVFRFFRATEPVGPDILLLALADHLATYDGPEDHAAAGREPWQRLLGVTTRLLEAYFTEYAQTVRPRPLIDGRTLMRELGIASGPEVGRLLRLIEENQAAGEVSTAAEALSLARRARAAP